MVVSKHTRGHPNIWGLPYIQGLSKHMGGIPTYTGHPNILDSKCMGVYGHSFSLTKHTFFVLCMFRGHPNIWGVFKDIGVSKHIGGI